MTGTRYGLTASDCFQATNLKLLKVMETNRFFFFGWNLLLGMLIDPVEFKESEIIALGRKVADNERIFVGQIGNKWCFVNYTKRPPKWLKARFMVLGNKITRLHPKETYYEQKAQYIQERQAHIVFSECQSPKNFQECRRNKKSRGPHCRIADKLKHEKKFYGVK